MAENYDIGPLTWVKEEIDKSLNTVLEALEKLDTNSVDIALFRTAKTHLYQASGALDMVSLEGCKFYASELEKCFSKLESAEIKCEPQLVQDLKKAVKALLTYLESLMQGASDMPIRLYDDLAPIVAVTGRELEKSELFFVDTTFAIPRDIPTQELSEDENQRLIANQRQVYQKSLLQWLQTKQDQPIKSMVESLRQVCYAQTRNAPKTLWWAASAFAETLKDNDVSGSSAAKRLCRKIDQELKTLQESAAKANPVMLKDLLYFVAISNVESDVVKRVKATFNLNGFNEQLTETVIAGDVDASELTIANTLLQTVQSVNELWTELSAKVDVSKSEGVISLDHVLLTKCVDLLESADERLAQLGQVVVIDLYRALSQSMQYINDHKESATQPALIELSVGMHLLVQGLTNYNKIDANEVQKILAQIQRLEQIASGEVYHQFTGQRASELEADTIKVVLAHIQTSLKTVEQTLDTFFRKPEDKSVLSNTLRPISEVSSAFHMLNFQVAADIAELTKRYINYFQSQFFEANEGEFELLAESLSMLGIYLDGMPKVKPQYEAVMQSALSRMQTLFNSLNVDDDKGDDVKVDLDAVADAVNQSADDGKKLVTDVAFDEELLDVYLTEAEEVLGEIAEKLQLLKTSASTEALADVRRGYHTLKGSGRTVGLTNLGEVAAQVEAFLNKIIDKKAVLTQPQVIHIEMMTAHFAAWASDLRDNQQLQFNLTQQINEIETWESLDGKESSLPETILIGGQRALSRQFFNIFLNESMLNITILEQDLALTTETQGLPPSEKARHAIHTLASNALAAGFDNMGTLGRAVELWLDETKDSWSDSQQAIYSRLIKALSRMWQTVSKHEEPKEEKALLRAIQKATPSLHKTESANTTQEQLEEYKTGALIEESQNEQLSDAIEITEISNEDLTLVDNAHHDIELSIDVTEQDASIPTDDSKISEVADNHLQVNEYVEAKESDSEILSLFMEEADELVPFIGNELRAWNKDKQNLTHADELQRALHTLKGSARMAGKEELGNVVHNMEERIVQSIKLKQLDNLFFDYLFSDLDNIGHFVDTGYLRSVAEENSISNQVSTNDQVVEDAAGDIPSKLENTNLIEAQNDTADDLSLDENQYQENEELPQQLLGQVSKKTQFLRMRAEDLDRVINEAGEISIIRSRIDKELLGFKHTSSDLTESVSRMKTYLRELEIEADTQLQSRLSIMQEANENFDPLEFDRFTRLQELTRMMAESVNDITTIQQSLVANLGSAEAALQQQNRMNRDLQQSLMSVRMLPFSQLSERLYRVVRQTAKELNKEVNFSIIGEETGIDRSVLEKIGAPLEHLLRNAVAHGLESANERITNNKQAIGQLILKINSHNDEINITIKDDGAGINVAKVKQVAINKGLISQDSVMSDYELTSLIFETGFSTADNVTQIAGRGVGLDVVRSDVTGLGGRIDVESQLGQGAEFTIYLPVTLSVANVLMVATQQSTYAISVSMIEQAQKVKSEVLKTAYDQGYVEWSENRYPIHYLSKLLNEDSSFKEQPYASLLLIKSGHYRIALHVDEMMGNQEVVLKDVGEQLARVPGMAGATVSGDGKIHLILNPVLLANREAMSAGAVKVKIKQEAVRKVEKLKALVVDDSLTMRKVLGRLMEREGYEVLLAKDGMDAIQMLQHVTPDIVLTDIEMPRMDGFGLSRNIRDDARTAQTPIIMISSRTADKHQNLAKEIGVNAFFGKPVQDEELISSVKTLLAQRLH